MNELISVVVPVYNVEAYLEKCVASIRNQTYKEIEIILVDDGSTDSSGVLCDTLSKQDHRIRVIHKKNGGLSEARNYGVDSAKGNYLSFIDSDDYIESTMLQTMMNHLQQYSADISVCAYDMEYPNKSVDIKEGTNVKVYTRTEAYKALLHKNSIGVIACNKLYKASLLQNVRYPVGKYFEDINTTYKIFANASKIIYIPQILYHYVQREDSINGLNFKKPEFNQKLYDMEIAADELLQYMRANYPAATHEIEIGCCDYYLRIINQEILFNIDNANLQNKARKLIINNKGLILQADSLTPKKKLQMFLFAYLLSIYKFVVRKMKG